MKKREFIYIAVLTLIIAFMDITGIPSVLFINIQVADIEPVYFTLMVNFLIIGAVAYLFLRILCPKWELGFRKKGLIDGFKKYGIIGALAAIAGFIAFYVGLSPFDCQSSIQKVFIEGVVYYIGVAIIEELYVRGKCFIEYIPAECAWAPIEAEGYMYIDCLWVSGQFKGHGYSNLLLDACIKDSKAKGKKGLVILSSKKKMGFLSDPKYMSYKGFQTVDMVEPYFELMYLPFDYEDEGEYFIEQTDNGVYTIPKEAYHLIDNYIPYIDYEP